jgi:hypothetical protein
MVCFCWFLASPETSDLQRLLQADARNRTGDPFITSEVLYQLSYVGAWGERVPRRSQNGPSDCGGEPVRAHQSSASAAQRSWSRQRPPIFR